MVRSFVAAVRPSGVPSFLRSWRPSIGFIQFALGSFYADCPHKRTIYNESIHGKEEHAQL